MLLPVYDKLITRTKKEQTEGKRLNFAQKWISLFPASCVFMYIIYLHSWTCCDREPVPGPSHEWTLRSLTRRWRKASSRTPSSVTGSRYSRCVDRRIRTTLDQSMLLTWKVDMNTHDVLVIVFMPPLFEEWWRGIKCYPCPCISACVCPSVIKIWCPLNNFWKTASIQFKFSMLIHNIKTQVEFDLGYNPLIFDGVMGLL